MKRFFILLCVLAIILPTCAFAAAKSPTVKNKIYSDPAIKFEVIDNVLEVLELDKLIPHDELEGYIWCEALKIELDKDNYEKVKWHLLIEMIEPKVVIIGEDVEVKDATIEDNMVVMDLTGYKPGTYYLCFFSKEKI